VESVSTHLVDTGYVDALTLTASQRDYGAELLGRHELTIIGRPTSRKVSPPVTSRSIGRNNRLFVQKSVGA
jgi:hypothetical protein